MMLRWKIRKKMIVGTAAIAEAAMIRFSVGTGKRGAPGWGIPNASAPHKFSTLPISNIYYPVARARR